MINSDDSPHPLVIAHRGDWRAAAQNSAESLRAAVASGADWAEVDLRLTADGELVLAHDEVVGGLLITTTALSDLRSAHPSLTTLAEALEAAEGLKGLDLELKWPIPAPDPYFKKLSAEIARWEGQLLLSSFFVSPLEDSKEWMPEVELGLLTAASLDPDGQIALDTARALGCQVVVPQDKSLTKKLIDKVHQQGSRAIAWTVNDAERIDALVEWGIDGIITDDVPLARGRLVR